MNMVHEHFHIGSYSLSEKRLCFADAPTGPEAPRSRPISFEGKYETEWATVTKHLEDLGKSIDELDKVVPDDSALQVQINTLKTLKSDARVTLEKKLNDYATNIRKTREEVMKGKFRLEKEIYDSLWQELVTGIVDIEEAILWQNGKLPEGYVRYVNGIRDKWYESLQRDQKMVAKLSVDAQGYLIYYMDMPDQVSVMGGGLSPHARGWGEKRIMFYAGQPLPRTVTVTFGGKSVTANTSGMGGNYRASDGNRYSREIHFTFAQNIAFVPEHAPAPREVDRKPLAAPPYIPLERQSLEAPVPTSPTRKPLEAPAPTSPSHKPLEAPAPREPEIPVRQIEGLIRAGQDKLSTGALLLSEINNGSFDWKDEEDGAGYVRSQIGSMRSAADELNAVIRGPFFMKLDPTVRERLELLRRDLLEHAKDLEQKLHEWEQLQRSQAQQSPSREPLPAPPVSRPPESAEDKFNKLVVEVDQLLVQLGDRVTLIGNEDSDPMINGFVRSINEKLAGATLPAGHGWHEFRLNRTPMVYRDSAGRAQEYRIRNIYWNEDTKNPSIIIEKHQESPSDRPPPPYIPDTDKLPPRAPKKLEDSEKPASKEKKKEKKAPEAAPESVEKIMEKVVGGFVNELKTAMSFEASQRKINEIVTKINTALNQGSYDKNVAVTWEEANQWMRSKLDTLNGVGYTVEYKNGTDKDLARLTVKEVGIDEKERGILDEIEKIFKENDLATAIEKLLIFLRDKGYLPKEPSTTPLGPKEGGSSPPPEAPDRSAPEKSETQKKIEKLKEDIKAIEAKLEEAKKRWKELLDKDSKLFDGNDAAEMRRLNQEIRKDEEALQAKKEELRRLTEGAEVKEGDLKKEIAERIVVLTREKEGAEKELNEVIKKIEDGDTLESTKQEKTRLEKLIEKITKTIEDLKKDQNNYVTVKPTPSKENPNSREIAFTQEELQKFVNKNLLKKLHDEIASESYGFIELVRIPVTIEGGKVNLNLVFAGSIDTPFNRLKSSLNGKMKAITKVEHAIDRSGDDGLIIRNLTQEQVVAIAKAMTGLDIKFKMPLSPDEEAKTNIEKWVKSDLELFVGDKKILSKVEIEVKEGKVSFGLVFHRDIDSAYVTTVPSLQKYLTQGKITWNVEKKAIILEGVTQADVRNIVGEYIVRWLNAMK